MLDGTTSTAKRYFFKLFSGTQYIAVTLVTFFLLASHKSRFADPKTDDLPRYFQVGGVAAYEYIEMIKLYYSIANAIDDCIAKLEGGKRLSPVLM
jgi:hypothetical protein